MMARKIAIIIVLALGLLAVFAGGLIMLVATVFSSSAYACDDDLGDIISVRVIIDGDTITVDGQPLEIEQLEIAGEIIGQGKAGDFSDRDIVIALATGYQESGLRNLDFGDRDSLGVYQQRPSQGWGTPAQILHVPYAVGKFYEALARVENRPQKTELEVALEVQRPDPAAYNSPDNRFTDWLPLARALLGGANDGPGTEMPVPIDPLCAIELPPGDIPRINPGFGPIGTCPAGTKTRVGDTAIGIQVQLCDVDGIEVEASISANLDMLLLDASADGIDLGGWGYRSHAAQIELRKQHCGTTYYAIWEMPSDQCRPPTAIPGQSDHETGQAVDFYSQFGGMSYGDPAHAWMRANGGKYGFIEHHVEPWHWSPHT